MYVNSFKIFSVLLGNKYPSHWLEVADLAQSRSDKKGTKLEYIPRYLF